MKKNIKFIVAVALEMTVIVRLSTGCGAKDDVDSRATEQTGVVEESAENTVDSWSEAYDSETSEADAPESEASGDVSTSVPGESVVENTTSEYELCNNIKILEEYTHIEEADGGKNVRTVMIVENIGDKTLQFDADVYALDKSLLYFSVSD